jgi:aspartyl-tRNA synthetase
MQGLNDSIVEQLHSAQRALGMAMQSTTSSRAMFLIQLINYGIYCKLAREAKFLRVWPVDAPVYSDDDDVAEAESSHAPASPDVDVHVASNEEKNATY